MAPIIAHQNELRQAQGPTLVEQVEAILNSPSTTEELRGLRPFYFGEELSALNIAISRREAQERASNVAPPENAEAPSLLGEAERAANREQATARINELKAAINAQLILLKANPEKAWRDLAERETGTEPGTLARARPQALNRLAQLPRMVRGWNGALELNAEREALLPEGTRAVDKLAEFKANQKSREGALLRLAQIKTLEAGFSIRNEIFRFDLDQVLANYCERYDSSNLRGWYDFAYRSNEGDAPTREDYERALNYYARSMAGRVEQYLTAGKYLSYIHDLLQKKQATINRGSKEEASFRDTVRIFIKQFVDANRGCVDQMTSQLEDLLLNLVAEDQSMGSGREQQFKFQAGLALCQQRAKLINGFTRELYPEEHHMADLERVVKKKLAEMLGLEGRQFQVGAAYDIVDDADQKAEKIGQAVFNKFNAPVFLLDETQSANNSVPATFYLRSQLTEYVSGHLLALANMDDNDPLPQSLALDHSGEIGTAAYEGGTLTFEGAIYYLEKAGILVSNRV
jgi:hypothetical protein